MKKLINVILGIMVACSVTTSFAEEEYKLSSWAKVDIEKAKSIGVLTEYFSTDLTENITRGQFCDLAFNLLQASYGKHPDVPAPYNPFDDTDKLSVFVLHGMDVVKGKGEKAFAPDEPILREEAAVILDRLTNRFNIVPIEMMDDVAYIDDADISEWAKKSVYNVREWDIMKGTDKGFEPKSQYSIEQAAITMVRMYEIHTPDYNFKALSGRLGSNQKGVLLGLKMDESNTERQEYQNGVDYTFKEKISIGNLECTLKVGFYNGVMVAFDYIYPNATEEIFNLSQEMLDYFSLLHSEPTTYPSLPNRLSSIDEYNDLQQNGENPYSYYDEWSIYVSDETLKTLFGNNTEQMNLVLRLDGNNDYMTITVRYSLDRNSNYKGIE